ncbi:MAG: hypothetical protein H0W70_01170 [Actinobacteria bacterium]|nr:hypothetical protein [Actinomycetota bacterium]
MNLERPEFVRALMAAAGLVLVVGLIGAFTVDSGDTRLAADRKTDRSAGETTITTTGDAGATTLTTGAAGPTTSAAPPTTKALSATTAPGTAAVPTPGAAKAPAPGTYTYKIAGTADPSSNGDRDAKVEALPDQGGAVGRRETYQDGSGNTLANEEAWSADAMRVSSSRIASPQGTVDCTWQPALLAFQFPLDVGKTWKTDSTCTTTVSGTQVTIHRVATSKVTGKSLDKVGDVSVPTWVIESTGTTTVRSAFFNSDVAESAVRHFAADRGLLTYEKATGTTNGRSGDVERTLRNVNPK